MSSFPVPVLSEQAELDELYREPSKLVQAKKRSSLDDASRRFIATSPLVFIASQGFGGVDVSPRGGDRGFVKVVETDGDEFLALPDLNGNNLIDTQRNVVSSAMAGVIFLIPGRDDTLRVNGAAAVTTADTVLDLFVEYRRPTSAILVRPDEVYAHCAKAFRRSHAWDPAEWSSEAPDLADIVLSQRLLDVDGDLIRDDLEAGYQADLAAERPDAANG